MSLGLQKKRGCAFLGHLHVIDIVKMMSFGAIQSVNSWKIMDVFNGYNDLCP